MRKSASCAGRRCSCFACGRRPSRAAREDRAHAERSRKALLCAERMEQRSPEEELGPPKDPPVVQPRSVAEGWMSAALGCAERGGGARPRDAAWSQAIADHRAKATGARKGDAHIPWPMQRRCALRSPRCRTPPEGSPAVRMRLHRVVGASADGRLRCRRRTRLARSPRGSARCRADFAEADRPASPSMDGGSSGSSMRTGSSHDAAGRLYALQCADTGYAPHRRSPPPQLL